MAQPSKKDRVGINSVQRNNTPLIIGGIAIVVALAVIAVIVAVVSSNSDESADTANAVQWQPVTATGTALPQKPAEGGTDPALGAVAPTLTGKTFTGSTVAIASGDRAKVVMFLAHWCPHCQAEVPLVSKWIAANRTKYNVDYFGVATGTDVTRANYPPSAWLAKEKWPAVTMADDRNTSAAKAYGLGSYPYFVFLDKNNKVVSRTSGEIPMTDFETYVRGAANAA